MKTGICAVLVLAFASVASAQSKTVTNADLEKFRIKRLAAEKDLRENYRELGFPSPEEMARSEEEGRRARAALVRELIRREEEEARYALPARPAVQTAPAFPYPNPSFVDYGGRVAPSYFYYRFYYPYGGRRYIRDGRYGRGYSEPPRFREFRRMWRQATGGRSPRR